MIFFVVINGGKPTQQADMIDENDFFAVRRLLQAGLC